MAESPDLRVGVQSPPTPQLTRLWKVPATRWTMAAAGVLLALAGYRHFANTLRSPPAARLPAAPVRVAKVERRDMAVVAQTLGTVLAEATVQVRARVEGLLQSAYF